MVGVAILQFGSQVKELLFLVVVSGEKVFVLLMEIFELLFEAFDVTFFTLAEGALRCSILSSTPLHERWSATVHAPAGQADEVTV